MFKNTYNRVVDIIPELRCANVDCTRIETSTQRILKHTLPPPKQMPPGGFRTSVSEIHSSSSCHLDSSVSPSIPSSSWHLDRRTPCVSMSSSEQLEQTISPSEQSSSSAGPLPVMKMPGRPLPGWTYRAQGGGGSGGADSGRSKVRGQGWG